MKTMFEQQTNEPPAHTDKRTVLVVDDHPIVCEGLSQHINHQSDLAVCGTAQTSAAALAAITRSSPDLVLLDLELPNCHGLEVLQDIHARYPALPVLILSMHEESVYAERALRKGARGYLMKSESPDCLLDGMRTVLNGGYALSRASAARVLHSLAGEGDEPAASPVASLCDRELEVFQGIGEGKGTREIAGRLCLSVKTVETYRERIKRKLQLKTAAELTRRAFCWVENGA